MSVSAREQRIDAHQALFYRDPEEYLAGIVDGINPARDRDEPGAIAKGFKGEVGRWEVVSTLDGQVLAQKAENPDATFNIALVSDSSAKDLDLFVRLKPVAGKEDQAGGEPRGWAAAYAPRQPVNNMERMAAMLRQYAEGNFTGASPWRTPGLSNIWRKGWQ